MQSQAIHDPSKAGKIRLRQVKAVGSVVCVCVCMLTYMCMNDGFVVTDSRRARSSYAFVSDGNTMLRMPPHDLITNAPFMSPADVSMTNVDWSGSPIVSNELRLIYCDIPKNACTVMKRTLLRVKGLRNWDSRDGLKVHDPATNGLTKMRDLDLISANRILHDPSWTRVVIVRDPIVRFAAGFLNKCKLAVFENDQLGDGNCPTQNITESQSAHRVLGILEQLSESASVLNDHFRPQSQFCDLHTYAPGYVFIDMNVLVPSMRKLIGRLQTPDDTKNVTWTALGEVLALKATRLHTTPSHDLAQTWVDEADTCLKVNAGNATACETLIVPRLRKLYAVDYKMFAGAHYQPLRQKRPE